MTRRDTIIAAVLVNAGLLIVLFASALKSDHSNDEVKLSREDSTQSLHEQPVFREAAASQVDEVDQVLKQYASPVQPVVSVAVAPAAEGIAAAPATGSSFADDLRAIALPEVPVQQAGQVSLGPKISQETSATIDYKVKKGDVLEKIARHHHCTVDEIMKLNRLSTVNLRIGQMLRIAAKAALATSASPAPAAAEGVTQYYIVKNGDNPWTIAVKNHMKVEDLLKLNNLDQEKARKLKPGDQLRIN